MEWIYYEQWGFHACVLHNGIVLKIEKISDETIKNNKRLIENLLKEKLTVPSDLYDEFRCELNFGGPHKLWDGGRTLEEAKERLVKHSIILAKQMLKDLGEDIELKYKVSEIM